MSVEVGWFSALCDDDYRYLGVAEPHLQSSWSHCSSITRAADRAGYDSILLPSGYELGIDAVTFAAGMSSLTQRIRLLLAIRCGEMWVPQLARQLATLDQMLDGRLSVNIISSDMPGAALESVPRYERTRETMLVLRELLNGRSIDFSGEHLNLRLDPPRIASARARCPLFYFGGLSEPARDVAAHCADVFLMWPDTLAGVSTILDDMRSRAAAYERRLRFGYRVHVIVRETEAEAIEASRKLMSKLEPTAGETIRARSLDSRSSGVAAQTALRDAADADGFAEEHLWTGIGRARSGCGAAIVGDPQQVLNKLQQYMALGIEAFILSGYPHEEECDLFARYVLPEIEHACLR